MTRTLKSHRIGTRTLACTDHPLELTIYRDQRTGQRPTWTVCEICNKIAERAKTFSLKRDALKNYAERLPQL